MFFSATDATELVSTKGVSIYGLPVSIGATSVDSLSSYELILFGLLILDVPNSLISNSFFILVGLLIFFPERFVSIFSIGTGSVKIAGGRALLTYYAVLYGLINF